MAIRGEKKRLDLVLVERGLAESRQKAQAMILAGEVRVDGTPAGKAGMPVAKHAAVEVHSRLQKYASRAGLKLEGALEDFGIEPSGRVCLDVGSSAGGFTDCLLQKGALRVYAVDVTTSQLAWKLQQHPRIVQIEKNARKLGPSDIDEPIELAVVDLSFISVIKVLDAVMALMRKDGELLILVKPQFELGASDVGRGGIVRDEALQEKATGRVGHAVLSRGFHIGGVKRSRLAGAEGNQEFFLHARRDIIDRLE